jgi:hypothetical protein
MIGYKPVTVAIVVPRSRGRKLAKAQGKAGAHREAAQGWYAIYIAKETY